MDLPWEILGLVYDMLEISDRVRLKMALPRGVSITKTMLTTTGNDTKLGVVHRFFKRRTRILGASAFNREDMSATMRKFFVENSTDPTICRIIHESPHLSKVSWTQSTDPATIIRQGQSADVGLSGIVWSDVEEDVVHIVQVVKETGTPAVFDSFMASDNCVRRHVLKNAPQFVFGLVNYMNACGLLAHIMQLGDENTMGFPVALVRRYVSSWSTCRIFLDSPEKLRIIVEIVGMPSSVMDDLAEDAARKMLIPTLEYLLQAGATL